MTRTLVSRLRLSGLLGFGLLALACATQPTSLRIETGPGQDFGQYRSWRLAAPQPGIAVQPKELRTSTRWVGTVVAAALRERGLDEAPDGDLVVEVAVEHRRYIELVDEPMAPYLLSSHSSSASYLIEGSRRKKHHVHDVRIAVTLRESEGFVVWRGEIIQRVADGASQTRDLDRAVAGVAARLAQHFPDELHTPDRGPIDDVSSLAMER